MNADSAASEPSTLVDGLALGTLAALAGLVSLKRLHDPDLFWHLRQGAWLLDRGPIPFPDPFSEGAEIPWRGVDCATDVLFAAVERAFGLGAIGALVALAAAALGALLFLIARGAGTHRPATIVVASLAVAACSFRFEPKSELFTMLAVAGWTVLRERSASERSPAGLVWSVPLIAGASLFHRGAFVLVGLLGLCAAAAAFAGEKGRARIAGASALGSWIVLMALWPGALDGLGSFELLTRSSYAETFAEWAPPNALFFTRLNLPFSALLILGALGLALRQRLDERALVGLALLALGLRAVRFVPLASIGLLPLAVSALETTLVRVPLRPVTRRLLPFFSVALPSALIGAQFILHTPPGLVGFGVLEWRLPVAAARFLREGEPTGRLYNSFLFGGYLMHALPERRVFVDGRNDLAYTDRYFRESIESGRSPEKLLELVDEKGLAVLVVRCSKVEDLFVARLLEDRRFVLVHLDDLAAVLVRRSAQTPEFLARYAYRELNPGRTLRVLTTGPVSATLAAEVDRYRATTPNSMRARLYASLLAERRGDAGAAADELAAARALSEERGMTPNF